MITGISVTVKGIDELLKKLDPKVFEIKARAGMKESLDLLYGIVRHNTPKDTGRAQDTLFTDIYGTSINLTGVIASPEHYFRNIEYGRRPGAAMPPEPPIRLWAERHGIEGRSAVFLIRRAIAKRGIPAKRIMEHSLEEARSRIDEIFLRIFNGYPN